MDPEFLQLPVVEMPERRPCPAVFTPSAKSKREAPDRLGAALKRTKDHS
jgi:hypothetical protein